MTGTTLPTRGESPRAARVRRAVTATLLIATLGAGFGFLYKVHEFLEDLLAEAGLGFAGSHLLVYALVALGFACLLALAFLKGHFAHIEEPKREMLAAEIERDAGGEL